MRINLKTAVLGTVVAMLVAACGSPSGGSATGSGDSGGTGGKNAAAQKAAKDLGIDLSKCPTDITKPLTGTVKIGATLALTGPVAAALAPVGQGQQAAVDYYNASGKLPVKLQLILKDDQFAPDKTQTAVQQLIQSDKVDLLDGVIGSANIAAARQLAQQYCVPIIAGNAGAQSANQPSKFPFTTIWSLPSYVDVDGWVQWLKEKFPQGAKIATYTANTESGQDYLTAIQKLTQGTKYQVVSKTTIDATDSSSPASQVTQMKASGANVLFAAPSPSGQCAAVIKEVANQGWKLDAFMLTSQCSPLALVSPAGAAAQGVLCNLYINDPQAATAASDTGLQDIITAVKKYAPGSPIVGSTMSGWSETEVLAKAMEQAATSPLGLSRLGILYAATHMTYQSSTILPGYSLNYPKDEVAMEGTQFSSFDTASGQWKKEQTFDFNGQTTGEASN